MERDQDTESIAGTARTENSFENLKGKSVEEITGVLEQGLEELFVSDRSRNIFLPYLDLYSRIQVD